MCSFFMENSKNTNVYCIRVDSKHPLHCCFSNIVGNFADMSELAGTWFYCTSVERLLNSLCVQHYNWSKHSVCTTSLDKKLPPCKVGGVLGLGRAEQFCTLSVHMLSCLYSTPGDSLAWVEVWRLEYSSLVAFFFGNTHTSHIRHTHKATCRGGGPSGYPT